MVGEEILARLEDFIDALSADCSALQSEAKPAFRVFKIAMEEYSVVEEHFLQ